MIKIKDYNKLVRDKIPTKIRHNGEKPIYSIASDADYKDLLKTKLSEECHEFLVSETPEELIDILEVVYALAKTKGLTQEDLEILRLKKVEENGAFNNKIFLQEVHKECTPL